MPHADKNSVPETISEPRTSGFHCTDSKRHLTVELETETSHTVPLFTADHLSELRVCFRNWENKRGVVSIAGPRLDEQIFYFSEDTAS